LKEGNLQKILPTRARDGHGGRISKERKAMHFLKGLITVWVRTVAAVQILCLVALALVAAIAIIAGLSYYPEATIIILAASAVAFAFVIGFCKAAAKGNIYCPACGSEDHKVVINYRENGAKHSHITSICKACGKKW
jgi:hypothetical protein